MLLPADGHVPLMQLLKTLELLEQADVASAPAM